MASDNPTLAAANASTGISPLNTQPSSPQPPNQHPTNDSIPTSLTSLPPNYEPIFLPLDLGSSTQSNQTLSSFPSANAFEDLVRAKIRPSGPVRAEEMEKEMVWMRELGDEGEDVVERIKAVVEEGRIRVYKVVSEMGKGEVFVVGLDTDWERLVGVRKAV